MDPAENAASGGHAGYYASSPRPGFRFIALDTTSEGGVPGPGERGNLDDPQWRWLERRLDAAERADELVVVFGHHPIRSMTSSLPDELAGQCLGADAHGHAVNPGCDRDPRDSRPLHDGEDLRMLLLAHPHVIAAVFGHEHENRVSAFRRSGGGGFWGIESPSHIDWPIQSRLIEVMENGEGTLSIFGTVLDVDAPVRALASGASASAFGVPELASVARTLAYTTRRKAASRAATARATGSRAIATSSCGWATRGAPRRPVAAPGRAGGSAASRLEPPALSSHPAYRSGPIRAGSTVRALRRRLRREVRVRVGSSTWYLARGHRARLVFRTSRGRVQEVGLADRRLTSTRVRARRFLASFR